MNKNHKAQTDDGAHGSINPFEGDGKLTNYVRSCCCNVELNGKRVACPIHSTLAAEVTVGRTTNSQDSIVSEKDANQSFSQWLSGHGCTKHELWLIQNMLGSCLGWEHPLYLEAKEKWGEKKEWKSLAGKFKDITLSES